MIKLQIHTKFYSIAPFLCFLSIFIFFSFDGSAQTESEWTTQDSIDRIRYLESMQALASKKTCQSPDLIAKAVVKYQSHAKLFIELASSYTQPLRLVNTTEGIDAYQELFIPNGKNGTFTVLPNKNYHLLAVNDCGNWSVITEFDSHLNKSRQKTKVEVSERMYEELISFLETNEPLDEFLLYNTVVSDLEKLSFYQQFFLKGSILEDEINSFSDIAFESSESTTNTNPPLEWRCLCDQLTIAQTVGAGVLEWSQLNAEFSHLHRGPNDPKHKFEDDASYWFWLGNQGPSKWHQLETEGWRARRGKTYSATYGNESETASEYRQFASMKFTYFCVDRVTLLPKFDCNCDHKLMNLWWQYSTQVTVRANTTGSGISNKRALAGASDIGIVILKDERTGDVAALDAVMVGIEANCNDEINGDFLVNIGETAKDILAILLREDGSQDPPLIDDVNELVDGIVDVLQTPVFLEVDCTNAVTREASMIDNDNIHLKPNHPMDFRMFSYDSLYGAGRRNWNSSAQIFSAFYLNTYVSGNGTDENIDTEMHCCSRHFGDWILSSWDDIPVSDDNLKAAVVTNLFSSAYTAPIPPAQAWGFIPNGTGGLTLVAEVGGRSVDHANPICNYYEASRTFGYSTTGGGDNEGHANTLVLYDLTGKYLGSKVLDNNVLPKTPNKWNLQDWFPTMSLSSGTYLLRIENKEQSRTVKIPVIN